jgi:hypothetical protein
LCHASGVAAIDVIRASNASSIFSIASLRRWFKSSIARLFAAMASAPTSVRRA